MNARLMSRRREAAGDRGVDPLHRILESGERMTRLIDQLLDFTRARMGGGFQLAPREVDLAEICRQALDELAAAHPDWRLKLELRGDSAGVWDPDRLLQVVSNLAANAGQHGAAGGEIRITLDGAERDLVTLEVHNAGRIPDAILARLFSPFQGTREHGASGLGLGTYITREIVRSHGGSLDVASSDAAGTTFKVRLPRHTALPAAIDAPAPGPTSRTR
jgi:signal transduction histidine kinase